MIASVKFFLEEVEMKNTVVVRTRKLENEKNVIY